MADGTDILEMTAEIVAAYLSNSVHVQSSEIPNIIRSVRAALSEVAAPAPASEETTQKATRGQINKSITPDHLISFVDGKPYKTLKRHLTRNGMTISDYRERYGLPNDYPTVAPAYSEARSQMAKNLGLGARGRGRAAATAPAKGGRKKAAPAGEPTEA